MELVEQAGGYGTLVKGDYLPTEAKGCNVGARGRGNHMVTPLDVNKRRRGRPKKNEWQHDPRVKHPVTIYFVDPETLK